MQKVAVNKDNKGHFWLDVCLCERFLAFVVRHQDIISTQPRLMWANRCMVNYRVQETYTQILRGPKCLYYQNVRIKQVEFREKVRAFFLYGKRKLSVIMRCRIKLVEFREKVRALFPQGQSKLSVIMRWRIKWVEFREKVRAFFSREKDNCL